MREEDDNYYVLHPDEECWACGGVCGEGCVTPCSRCGVGVYCDARCERADRRRHAAVCALIAA
jgi:hypothetical protein